MGMDFKGLVWKMGVKNDISWSEIGSGFGEQDGTLPPRISRSTPYPPPPPPPDQGPKNDRNGNIFLQKF